MRGRCSQPRTAAASCLALPYLRFNPTIITAKNKQYIKIKRDNYTKQLVINKIIKQQFLERKEESKLLREATKKDVVNVARYYHHETVYVGSQDNDIYRNIQRGLDITKATNYRLESSMLPPNTARRRVRRRVITSLLATLEGYIKGYELLHTQASMLQCNILLNNLIHLFLINLNLAIKKQQEKSSRAQEKTST
ncbi:hypothetical protein BCR34DRAFT_627614 [Clohesyomyces aquaticus]|uniref:Fungal-type protein kinase domain-containing protein n=1 Tax=Clohesyomyces aquaticus TaxID=1231657 RepID=A0A1Y1YWQ0_9PLEO|nr:hypothetical protein BCR34DRAFT_627614 [Clohesyomyces aquaticus]